MSARHGQKEFMRVLARLYDDRVPIMTAVMHATTTGARCSLRVLEAADAALVVRLVGGQDAVEDWWDREYQPGDWATVYGHGVVWEVSYEDAPMGVSET